jgi:A/G-specific adenine glycosylase
MTQEVQALDQFQQTVWQHYDQHARHDLPWRQPEADGSFNPYKVVVSELMLQQTQVNRVIPKYLEFLERFPTVQDLAKASLGNVLIAWQGLGYNRRAKFLWQAAQMVVNDFNGEFPQDQKELTKLPGIGINTAGAVMTYAYNQPVVFLETNVRTVYIHHFFADKTDVPDKEIAALVEQTLPKGAKGEGISLREWYWALMDYGTYIKQTQGNKSRASKAYVKQSPFHGSKRKVRGAVIRYLSEQSGTFEQLAVAENDPRLTEVISELLKEDMIREDQGYYRLA